MTDPKDDVAEPEPVPEMDDSVDDPEEADAISTLEEENPPPPKDHEIPVRERPTGEEN